MHTHTQAGEKQFEASKKFAGIEQKNWLALVASTRWLARKAETRKKMVTNDVGVVFSRRVSDWKLFPKVAKQRQNNWKEQHRRLIEARERERDVSNEKNMNSNEQKNESRPEIEFERWLGFVLIAKLCENVSVQRQRLGKDQSDATGEKDSRNLERTTSSTSDRWL